MPLHEVCKGKEGEDIWEIWKGAVYKAHVISVLNETCSLLGKNQGCCK